MTRTEGNLEALAADATIRTVEVLIRASMGEFGLIPEEALSNLSGALGTAMGDIYVNITEGMYS